MIISNILSLLYDRFVYVLRHSDYFAHTLSLTPLRVLPTPCLLPKAFPRTQVFFICEICFNQGHLLSIDLKLIAELW